MPNDSERVISAISKIYDLFLKLVASAAGLSFISLFIGWMELHSYYEKLGAPWSMSMFSSTYLMWHSLDRMLLLSTGVICGLYLLAKGESSSKECRYAALVIMLFGIPFLFLSFDLFNWLSASTRVLMASTFCVFYVVSAGMTVSEMVARFSERNLKWIGDEAWLIFIGVFVLLYFGQFILGTTRALCDSIGSCTQLSKLHLDNPKLGENWRLLTVSGDKALIMIPGEIPKNNKFKVIDVIDIDLIDAGMSN